MYRDNDAVGRPAKSDDSDIERDRHIRHGARDGLNGIAVPETAGSKIVVVVLGRQRRGRGFARRRTGRQA
jgi:hypothetical protein